MPLHRTFIPSDTSDVDELEERLIQEWRSPQQDAKEPLIQEVGDEAHEHPTRLRVIWNAWKDISGFERSVMIMQAYEKVRGTDEVLYVVSAEGLTFEEARQRGIGVAALDVAA